MEAIAMEQQAPSIQLTDMEQLAQAQERIAALKGELKEWQEKYDAVLPRVLQKAIFSEDRFLKAIKRKGDIFREGDYKLIRKPTVRRAIRRDDFVKQYPEVFNRIATIPLKEAEAEIGKKSLDTVCDTRTTYGYEVVDMRVI